MALGLAVPQHANEAGVLRLKRQAPSLPVRLRCPSPVLESQGKCLTKSLSKWKQDVCHTEGNHTAGVVNGNELGEV